MKKYLEFQQQPECPVLNPVCVQQRECEINDAQIPSPQAAAASCLLYTTHNLFPVPYLPSDGILITLFFEKPAGFVSKAFPWFRWKKMEEEKEQGHLLHERERIEYGGGAASYAIERRRR